uniref:Lectin/glucanase superfamily protein n=1 Tax=viral metagenome TaxID=1070528 RepID=A0A6C0EUA2_9ZZZZ
MSRRRTSLNSYRRAYGCCVVTTKYGDVPNNEPPAVPTIVTDGLIIRYEAGDTNSYSGSGNIWRNIGSGGSAYDASTNNLPTFSDASFNFGYSNITTVNGYLNYKYFNINRTNILGNILSNDFTYCAWIKTTNVGQGTDHFTLMYIISAEVPGDYRDYGFGIDSNGKLAYGDGLTNGSDTTIRSINSVNTGSWKFVCVTRQQSLGTICLYINGTLDSTGTCNKDLTGTPAGLYLSPNILIGAQSDSAGYTFGGSIRAIFGYSRVLTASEILNNFNVQRSSYGV